MNTIPELDKLAAKITGPVPFWFINGPITREDVAKELETMLAKGINEVVVHPRYGLDVPYLSDQWFEIFRWCIEEAKARNMFVWLYDEFNWPSGTAGMTVQGIDPTYMSKYLNVEIIQKSDIDLLVFEPGQFLIAAREQGGKITRTKVLDTVDAISALEGNWKIFNCRIQRDKFYIDTLSSAAVDCFKRLTYDEYYNRFAPEFGKTIRAIFTDEPSIYWVSVGYDDMNLPYTERMFPGFEERYGYSAVPNIPYLFFPGKPSSEFRVHFWQHVANLFNTNYHGNLSSWCREHNVIYTGHNNHEEPLRYQIRFQGDMFGMTRTMDIPGVDHLRKETLGNFFISLIGHKIASSSAHLAGKSRVMSESFGCMDWDATFLDLKKVVDWQYSLGINLLVPHALFHTIAGKMKRESPPSFFIQSPLWGDFGCFSQYVDRLTDMLTGGKAMAKILVLYPLSGLFSSYQSDRKTQEFEHIDNFLSSLCLELMKNHLDYELVDSTTLASAKIEDSMIKIGDNSYTILVVPSTPYLQPNECELIEHLAGEGIDTYFFQRAVDGSVANNSVSPSGINFRPSEEVAGFAAMLRQKVSDDLRLHGQGSEDISVLRREKDGQQIAFLVNRTEHHRSVSLELAGRRDVTLMRPEDGSTFKLPLWEKGAATLDFQPHQSFFVLADSEHVASEEVPFESNREQMVEGLELQIESNIASLYQFIYSDEGERKQIDVREAPAFIPVNWDPNPPDFSSYAGEYTTFIDLDVAPSGFKLVVDRDYESYRVYINGQEVMLLSGETWLVDPMDLSADVSNLLKLGRNEIKVLADSKLSEPIRIMGNFDVITEDHNVRLVAPGSAMSLLELEKTLPFYSGTMIYRANFKIDADLEKVVLDLGEVHDTALVRVNGKEAGCLLWAPYNLDITSFIEKGKNNLEIEVRNSMANLMFGDPKPLGLRTVPMLKIQT